ncbi:21375_t:CDS:1, partial [Dentiscutata erythropus]
EKSSILKSCDASISYLTDKENINPKKITTDSLEKKEVFGSKRKLNNNY